ncbi:MAG: hypothetical protein IPK74_10435 [Deltaproteobacteria bacterium]|nr:hypothetical protein [Deltaproteobacteria bacterium]
MDRIERERNAELRGRSIAEAAVGAVGGKCGGGFLGRRDGGSTGGGCP